MARGPFAPATQILASISGKFETVETPKKMKFFCLVFQKAIVVVKRLFDYSERLSAPSFRQKCCLVPGALIPTGNQALVCEIYQPGPIPLFRRIQGSPYGITRTRIGRQPAQRISDLMSTGAR